MVTPDQWGSVVPSEFRPSEYRVFPRQAPPNTFLYLGLVYAEGPGPIDQEPSFSSNRDLNVPPRVPRLLPPGSPLYVSRFVVTVVVNAFDGQPWNGPPSDMTKERLETILPFFTDCDPPCSIIAERRATRVQASVFDSPPYLLFWPLLVIFSGVFPLPFWLPTRSSTHPQPPSSSSVNGTRRVLLIRRAIAGESLRRRMAIS